MNFDLSQNNIKKKLEIDGYVVIKNVFSKNEINSLRKILSNHFKNNQTNVNFLSKTSKFFLVKMLQPLASVHIPSLWWIYSHPKVVEIVKIILGDSCVYTNVSDAQIANKGGWHKDDGTTGANTNIKGYFQFDKEKNVKCDGKKPYELDDCKVYKVALYLQDHAKNSCGLFVRPGSHKTDFESSNQPIKYLKTRVGDIVIFDVRINHSGRLDPIPLNWNSSNIWFKDFMQYLIRIPKLGRYINDILTGLVDILLGKKYSLFWVYGADNEWTYNFTKSMARGMKKQVRNENDRLPDVVKNPLLKAGIKTYN